MENIVLRLYANVTHRVSTTWIMAIAFGKQREEITWRAVRNGWYLWQKYPRRGISVVIRALHRACEKMAGSGVLNKSMQADTSIREAKNKLLSRIA